MRASLFALFMLGGFLGCQTPGRVVATETSAVCPQCKVETKTRSIKGLTYKVDVCPSCKTTWEPRGGSNYDEDAYVHVCDMCKIMTEKCPVCAQKK
jgi:predicted  nucleic acid-binding Zn ribbon protein